MSQTFVSVLDMLEQGDRAGLKAVREEVFAMELAVKKHMDAGLAQEEVAAAEKIRAATQAAGEILQNLEKV